MAATTNPRPDTPVRAVATRFAFSVGEIYEAMHINERDDYYALSGLGQFTMARFQRCRGRLLLMSSRRRRVRRMRFRKQGCARNEYGDDRGERKNLLHGIAPGSLKPVQYCARLRSAPATPRSSFRAAWLLTKVIVTVRDCSLKAAENQQSDQRDRHCTKRDCNKRECHVTHAL